MKSKFFVILAIIALVGFVVTLDYGGVWAQQYVPTKEELEEGKWPIPVEHSTAPFDVDATGAADPEQVNYRDCPAFPYADGFDFGGDGEVDALANVRDALFWELIHPSGRRADLVFSLQGDPRVPQPDQVAAFIEYQWTFTHIYQCGCLFTHPGLDPWGSILPNNDTRELDALELWGPQHQDDWFDADHYSLVGDPGTPKVSIFYYDQGTGQSTPYVFHSVIQPAVQTLGYSGPDVDLDAAMVWDNTEDHVWNAGDGIIFSIRAAGNWNGGEIVVLLFGGPPSFLFHAGHLWDTNWATTHLQPTYGTTEVDAIEADPCWWFGAQTPTLTEWGLIILVALLIASTVFVMLKRRKAVVRA